MKRLSILSVASATVVMCGAQTLPELTPEQQLQIQQQASANGLSQEDAQIPTLTTEQKNQIGEIVSRMGRGNADGSLSSEQQDLVNDLKQQMQNSGRMPGWLETLLMFVPKQQGGFTVKALNKIITDPIEIALQKLISAKKQALEQIEEQIRDMKKEVQKTIGAKSSASPLSTQGLTMPDPSARRVREMIATQLSDTGEGKNFGGGAFAAYLVAINNWEAQVVRYDKEIEHINDAMSAPLTWGQRVDIQNRLHLLTLDVSLRSQQEDAAAKLAIIDQLAKITQLRRERNDIMRSKTAQSDALSTMGAQD